MLPHPQTLTLAPAGNHSLVLFGGKAKVFILDVMENLELEFIFKNDLKASKEVHGQIGNLKCLENMPEFENANIILKSVTVILWMIYP